MVAQLAYALEDEVLFDSIYFHVSLNNHGSGKQAILV
jgi:hypothetical protein